jgi:hypothetical protein
MSDLIINLSSKQLRRAAVIRQRIENLEDELAGLLKPGGVPRNPGSLETPSGDAPAARRKARRSMSAAARAKLAASARKRWAKAKAAGRNRL